MTFFNKKKKKKNLQPPLLSKKKTKNSLRHPGRRPRRRRGKQALRSGGGQRVHRLRVRRQPRKGHRRRQDRRARALAGQRARGGEAAARDVEERVPGGGVGVVVLVRFDAAALRPADEQGYESFFEFFFLAFFFGFFSLSSRFFFFYGRKGFHSPRFRSLLFPLHNQNKKTGGAAISLTYLASERIIPGYGEFLFNFFGPFFFFLEKNEEKKMKNSKSSHTPFFHPSLSFSLSL